MKLLLLNSFCLNSLGQKQGILCVCGTLLLCILKIIFYKYNFVQPELLQILYELKNNFNGKPESLLDSKTWKEGAYSSIFLLLSD